VNARASVAIYLLKTVETKSEFPHHHSHTFAFLLFSYFFCGQYCPIWTKVGLWLVQKMKSIVFGPTALYLNLMKDFSLMMQL
jgi:hypothetical protein